MKKILLFIICALFCLPTMAKHHKKSSSKSHHKTHYVRKKIDQSIEHDTLSAPQTLADSIIFEASRHLGKPYRSGNKGPYAFDCSGFTGYVYNQFGIKLGSNSRDQFLQGVKISREHVKKGDLIFFAGHDSRGGVGHVGIVFDVAPDGKSFRFIHAANSLGISIARYPDMGYYSKRFRGIRRIIDATAPAPLPVDNTFYATTITPPKAEISLDNKSGAMDLSVSQEAKTYTVKKGENIYSIAKKNGCTTAQLMKWNKLTKGTKLRVGQQLVVKPAVKKANDYLQESIQEAENAQLANTDDVKVTVGDGETIYSLSQKYHCTVKEIVNWNKLKSTNLKVGQEIAIRPASAAGTIKKDTVINGELVHTVKKGENIYQIARKYGCKPAEVKKWNNLPTYAIGEGKQLIIKGADKGDVHTVVAGETLNSLASKYGCTTQDLKKWNHLTSNNIRPGMMLKYKADAAGIDHLQPSNQVAQKATTKDTTSAQPASEEKYTYYVVRGGDTFRKISNRFGCTTNQIMEWNDLNSYVLKPGKRLIVAKGDVKGSATTPTPTTETKVSTTAKKADNKQKVEVDVETEKGGNVYYTVKSGDTFRKIANKYGCTTSQIISWNHLKGYTLRPNTQLIVRKGVVTPKETPAEVQPAVEATEAIAKVEPTNETKVASSTVKKETNKVEMQEAKVEKKEAKKEAKEAKKEAKEAAKEATKVDNNQEANVQTAEKANSDDDSGNIYYYVKGGDTFRQIANRYGCTTAQIMEWNNLKSYALRGNQRLIVGKKKTAAAKTNNNAVKTEKKVSTPTSEDNNSSSVESGDNIYYYVQSGDTFKKIANKYGCTTAQIMEWNNLKSYALRGNQRLIVGKKKGTKANASTTKTGNQSNTTNNNQNSGSSTYTVQSGDNLFNIAKRNNCTVSQLKEWNNLKDDKLSLGQKLIIKQ